MLTPAATQLLLHPHSCCVPSCCTFTPAAVPPCLTPPLVLYPLLLHLTVHPHNFPAPSPAARARVAPPLQLLPLFIATPETLVLYQYLLHPHSCRTLFHQKCNITPPSSCNPTLITPPSLHNPSSPLPEGDAQDRGQHDGTRRPQHVLWCPVVLAPLLRPRQRRYGGGRRRRGGKRLRRQRRSRYGWGGCVGAGREESLHWGDEHVQGVCGAAGVWGVDGGGWGAGHGQGARVPAAAVRQQQCAGEVQEGGGAGGEGAERRGLGEGAATPATFR